MRNIKKGWFRGALNGFFIDSPLPGNLSYFWNFGSLLGATLALQIVTGVGLAMHYNPSISLAFSSVEHITRDVFGGSLLRYAHANGASVFFIIIFLHIGRNLYYGSFTKPRVQLWAIGVVILILLIVIAFLGYVCPWGQMSLWGAVVITNLLSVIPWVGTDLVEFIWGGFSVGNPTLNRFFALHFLAPFILSALVFGHLMALHSHGSNNPTGVFSGTDKGSFNPYYSVKDLVTLVLWLQLIVILACYMPNVLGHPDNYIQADPMVTPLSIVPEWYLCAQYAILRAIPNKTIGVIALLGSLLVLLVLPYINSARVRSGLFRKLSVYAFWFFVGNFLALIVLGSAPIEAPYVNLTRIAGVTYFLYYLMLTPLLGKVENLLARVKS